MKSACNKKSIHNTIFDTKIIGKQGLRTRPDQALNPKGNVQPGMHEVSAISHFSGPQHASKPCKIQLVQLSLDQISATYYM